MTKKFFILALAPIFFAGCATARTQPMTTQLQMRVGELEREVEMKDEQIKDLEYTVKDLNYEVDRMKSSAQKPALTGTIRSSAASDDRIIRVNATAQEVQQALKKAGYYKGAVDGNVGSGTKSAISKFQMDKGLNADGIIGQKTWIELKTYLE